MTNTETKQAQTKKNTKQNMKTRKKKYAKQKNLAQTHIGDQRRERCICWWQRSNTRGECSTRACARKKEGDDVFFLNPLIFCKFCPPGS